MEWKEVVEDKEQRERGGVNRTAHVGLRKRGEEIFKEENKVSVYKRGKEDEIRRGREKKEN